MRSATFSERPCCFSPALMCSYWRSRFALQLFCGMRHLLPATLQSACALVSLVDARDRDLTELPRALPDPGPAPTHRQHAAGAHRRADDLAHPGAVRARAVRVA